MNVMESVTGTDTRMELDTELEPEQDKVSWVGPSVCRPVTGIVVVAPAHRSPWLSSLSTALHAALSRYTNRDSVAVHQCHDTASLFSHTLSFDLLIVCIDTSRLDCADWARKMILQCSDDLRPGRVAIVNGTGLPALDLAVPPDTVVQLKRDLKVHLLNANLNDEFECRHISKRIGVILNAVLGMQTGVPYLII